METIYFKFGDLIDLDPLALAIGYFDGIHLGHQKLIEDAVNFAKENHCKSGLMTFSPSPDYVLGKVKEEYVLTTNEDKAQILEQLGVDYFIIVEFTKEISQLSTRDFYNAFLKILPLRNIICGFDFHFGFKGQGDGETLKELSRLPVIIQSEVTDSKSKISTTRIKKDINKGDIEKANNLLGRKYKIEGAVIRGRQIGRKIGFRTANIDYGHYLVPAIGVYAVKFEVRGQTYIGMANIGYNPTFTALQRASLEINIFDFDEDIYDEIGKVYFYHMCRPETRFSSPEALIRQLNKDKQSIRQYFEKLGE